MHSTVLDLFVWSEALKNQRMLSPELTKRMFTPNKQGYCYGWIRNQSNLVEKNSNVKLYFHNGDKPGYHSDIALYDDGTTIISLTNISPVRDSEFLHKLYLTSHNLKDEYGLKGYPDWGSIAEFEDNGGVDALNVYFKKLSELCGYEVQPSVRSLMGIMSEYLKEDKVEVANKMKQDLFSRPYLRESTLNRLGYYFLQREYLDFSYDFFAENTRRYPYSANTWDSLGGIYLLKGDVHQSIAAYKKAIEIAKKGNDKALEDYIKNLEKAQRQL